MNELIEKKERLITAKEAKEKNNLQIKCVNEENEQLNNEIKLILQSINDLRQSILNFNKLKETKEKTKEKIGISIIFSIAFSFICTVTTFREFNLVAIFISTLVTSIISSGMVSKKYLELKKDFKYVSLEKLELMLEKEEQEKRVNRKKYELNNLELEKLLTRNRVLDVVIKKITTELLQEETYDEVVINNSLEPIDKTKKEKEKVKTYSNN